MKRIAILLATIILLSSFVGVCSLESVNATSAGVGATEDEASTYDKEILEIFERKQLTEIEKTYYLSYLKQQYNVNYDGDDNVVLVYLTERSVKLYEQGKIEYSTESFADIGAVSVVDTRKTYNYSSSNWYILQITLDKHDKMNVLNVINKLNQRDDILYAKPTIYAHLLNSTTAAPKKANPMTVTVKTKTVKAKKLKKGKLSVKAITVNNAEGKVSFKKLSGSKKLTVTKKGKITIKKGTKKGTYRIKVKITAKGNAKYKPKTLSKTVKIKIK